MNGYLKSPNISLSIIIMIITMVIIIKIMMIIITIIVYFKFLFQLEHLTSNCFESLEKSLFSPT